MGVSAGRAEPCGRQPFAGGAAPRLRAADLKPREGASTSEAYGRKRRRRCGPPAALGVAVPGEERPPPVLRVPPGGPQPALAVTGGLSKGIAP